MAKRQNKLKSEGEAPAKKRTPKEAVEVVVPPKVRYVNPLIDYGFKLIFGIELLLIDFLNTILKLRRKIVKIEYRNVEQKGRTKAERSAFFDLHCTTSNDEYIIIEMQKMPQPFFADRVLYYVSLLIQKQAKRGKWDFNLKPIYFVGILDFKISDDTNKEEYHHEVQLLYKKTKRQFYNKLGLFFIELSDFNKTEDELKTNYDWWLYILKNLPELKEIPEGIKDNKIFKKLHEEAEIANMTPEELNLYDESLKNYWNMTPNDIVRAYKRELATSQRELATSQNTIESLQSNNDALQRQVAEYQRRYGILDATSGALSKKSPAFR